MSNNTQLEVKNLRKHFVSKRSVTNAIDNVSFVVPKGKVVGLIGESGSGKTTIGRSIIRLHIPNSGSVTMDGYEFATKKISKDTRKHLRKNVQMIFQDPYASLNGQKNIMSIVSEPLIVNGTHNSMLKDMLNRRDDVIEFFGFSLKREHLDDYSKYEEYKLATTKNVINELNTLLSDFNHKTEKSAISNIEDMIRLYFDKIDIAKIKILTDVRDLFTKSLVKWESFQNKLDNDKYLDEFEENLKVAREKVAIIEEKFRTSDEFNRLNDLRSSKSIELNEIGELISLTEITSKKIVSEFSREYHVKFIEYKSKAETTPTYGEFNYLNFLATQNKFMVNVLSKISGIKKLAVPDLGQILEEFDSNVLAKSETEIEKLVNDMPNKKAQKAKGNFFESVLFEEMLNELFARISQISSLWQISHKKTFDDLKIEIDDLDKKIAAENLVIKSRINDTLNEELKLAKEQENAAATANDEARIKFAQENEKTLLIKLDKLANVIQKDIADLKPVEKESLKLLQTKIREVVKLMKNEQESVSVRKLTEQKRKINFMLQDRLSRVKQFNVEIEKNEKELKLIRKLFNITNSNDSITVTPKAVKLNVIDQRMLRSLLVRRKVFKTLVEVGMNESHASRYPHEFSGGMRQRVGIARAIINDPKLIIADEPIAALDLSIQAQVMNLLMKLKRERNLSMIFIAHDLSMIRYNSDYIQIMHLGKIVEHGNTESVFTNPVHPYTKNLISSMPEISEISKGFKGNTFKPEYLKNYTHINMPTYHKISEGHYVLADEMQIIEWSAKKESTIAKIESKKVDVETAKIKSSKSSTTKKVKGNVKKA